MSTNRAVRCVVNICMHLCVSVLRVLIDVQMSPDEFNKFMHARGIRREGDMKRLEEHVRQSFKVSAFFSSFSADMHRG